jgi:hypothetical protein
MWSDQIDSEFHIRQQVSRMKPALKTIHPSRTAAFFGPVFSLVKP